MGRIIGYSLLGLLLLAAIVGGKQPAATATTATAKATPSVAAGDSKLRDADLRAAAEAFRLRPQDFASPSVVGGTWVFLSRCRSVHPELSPAAVTMLNGLSPEINRRYDTSDMTRLMGDVLLHEYRERGAEQWCSSFKKLVEEATR